MTILFRYKPVEEPGKRGGFLERLLTVVTSALQVIMMMMVVVMLIVVIMVGWKQCPAGRVRSGIRQNTGLQVGFGSGRSVEI